MTIFERRHYVAIAHAVHGQHSFDIVAALVSMFEADNPRFDERRFRLAVWADDPCEPYADECTADCDSLLHVGHDRS